MRAPVCLPKHFQETGLWLFYRLHESVAIMVAHLDTTLHQTVRAGNQNHRVVDVERGIAQSATILCMEFFQQLPLRCAGCESKRFEYAPIQRCVMTDHRLT